MNAASKSTSIVDDKEVAPTPTPATPAALSEIVESDKPKGPQDTDLGMTPIVDNSRQAVKDETIHMVHADGTELDVNAADVTIHERSGWKKKEA